MTEAIGHPSLTDLVRMPRFLPLVKPWSMPKILLVDDDPLYVRAFVRFANSSDVPVAAITSLQAFEALENWDFDVAVIDYDLRSATGLEFAAALEQKIGAMPMLLISNSDQHQTRDADWPASIGWFVNKEKGFRSIIDTAASLYEATPRRRRRSVVR